MQAAATVATDGRDGVGHLVAAQPAAARQGPAVARRQRGVSQVSRSRSRSRRPAPVIIYDASPKVINVDPAYLKVLAPDHHPDCIEHAGPSVVSSVVTTGQNPRHECSYTLAQHHGRCLASARLTTIERAVRSLPLVLPRRTDYEELANSLAAVLGLPRRPGILSPPALPLAASSG